MTGYILYTRLSVPPLPFLRPPLPYTLYPYSVRVCVLYLLLHFYVPVNMCCSSAPLGNDFRFHAFDCDRNNKDFTSRITCTVRVYYNNIVIYIYVYMYTYTLSGRRDQTESSAESSSLTTMSKSRTFYLFTYLCRGVFIFYPTRSSVSHI